MADLNTIGGIHYEMMRRCYNEKSVAYKDYGAKGIKVCNEWHDREEFKKWCLANGYIKGLRLNRADSSMDYCPDNCFFGRGSSFSSGISKRVREIKNHRKQMKEFFGVPDRYSNLRIYRIYNCMHSRCERDTHIHYNNYGGRGITVCEEWSGKYGFFYFYKWAMENGYKSNLSIDRIDADRSYCPENCRWATRGEQVINRRNSRNFIYNGNLVNLQKIATENKTTYSRLHRLVVEKGMTIEEALIYIENSTR